jgi:hypothetical protein
LLVLVVDGLGAAGALGVAQLVALRLQLLFRFSISSLRFLSCCFLGLVLLLQVGEVALAFVGLGHGHLKGNDGNLGRSGRRRGGAAKFGRRRSGQNPRPA